MISLGGPVPAGLSWDLMVDCDWPRLRRVLEAWLDESNLDAAGRQRSRLSEATAAALTGA